MALITGRAARRHRMALLALLLLGACRGRGETTAAPPNNVLSLAPFRAVIFTRDSLQYHSDGFKEAGADGAERPRYRVTGGGVTGTGLYSAPDWEGHFLVIATLAGTGQADTSHIMVVKRGKHSYQSAFPSTEEVLSDGGRWANGGLIGLEWSNVATRPGRVFGLQTGRSYSDATALLTGEWLPNQMVAATVYVVSAQWEECYPEVELRLRSTLFPRWNAGYEVSFEVSSDHEAYLIVVRWNGPFGNFTYLLKRKGPEFGVRDGDVVSAKAQGDTIFAYKNGVELARVTDAAYAGGNPGIGFNLENARLACRGTNSRYGFSSFLATDEELEPRGVAH